MKTKLVVSLLVVCSIVAPALAKPPIAVDCTKGQKIQDAVDKNAAPLVIEVHGICTENVTIVGKDFTLKGADPATDGIVGVAAAVPTGALNVNKVVSGAIANLSFNNGPQFGVAFYDSQVDLQNCRATGNGSSGLHVSAGSFVTATNLTASQNLRGVHAQRGAQFACSTCRFENNTSYAFSAYSGASVVVEDFTISGPFGVQATGGGSLAQLYCIVPATGACSMNITQRAATARDGATINFYVTPDFRGQLDVSFNATITLGGSRQLPWVTPPSPTMYLTNRVNGGGTLMAYMLDDEGGSHESQVALPTNVNGFGRLLVQSSTTLAASVQCLSAGDAWMDASVIKAAGVTVTGCEHAVWP